ncbi:MAG: permease, partial [Armatimonadota bacterium]
MERTLGERLDRSQFSVLTQEDLLKLVFKFMGILTWLVSGLTGIGLVIGGLGIMTTMLLAVGERTGEIGIRMAVGATRKDVFLQFLGESVILSAIGAVSGLCVGGIASLGLNRFSPVHPLITPGLVIGTLGVGLMAGAIFGLLPAQKAARLD